MKKPQTVGDGFPSDVGPPRDCRRLGIEIEVEKVNEPLTNYWQVKHDDSLRNNGKEFFSHPIPLKDVEFILDDFYKAFEKGNYEANRRTGIHVHVDARDYTLPNIATVSIAYALLEPLFMQFVGPEREENIYCVPWYRADSDIVHIRNAVQKRSVNDATMCLAERVCKYSGFYLEPLRRFGTIEFRHAPTWSTKEPLLTWVNMCYNLVEWGANHSPEEVLTKWHALGAENFATEVLDLPDVVPAKYHQLCLAKDVEVLAEALSEPFMSSPEEVDEDENWQRLDVKLSPALEATATAKAQECVTHPAFISSSSLTAAITAVQAAGGPQPFQFTTAEHVESAWMSFDSELADEDDDDLDDDF